MDFKIAEDSFLKIFGNKKVTELGEIYSWKEGGAWPKYNFLRPHFSLDCKDGSINLDDKKMDWINKNLDSLESMNKKPSIRADIKADIPNGFEQAGTPLVHLKYWQRVEKENKGAPEGFSLRCCEKTDLDVWWNIHSEFTEPAKLQPIYDRFHEHFSANPQDYFLLHFKGVPTHSIAIIQTEGLLNCWGANTIPEYRGLGHYSIATDIMFK
ncbi:MAG: hypothetical protein AB8E15_07005 [Bdellovibrionales bacterium]